MANLQQNGAYLPQICSKKGKTYDKFTADRGRQHGKKGIFAVDLL